MFWNRDKRYHEQRVEIARLNALIDEKNYLIAKMTTWDMGEYTFKEAIDLRENLRKDIKIISLVKDLSTSEFDIMARIKILINSLMKFHEEPRTVCEENV